MQHFRKGKPPISSLEENLCTHYNLIGSCFIDQNYRVVLPSTIGITEIKKTLMRQKLKPKLLITLAPDNVRMSYLVIKIPYCREEEYRWQSIAMTSVKNETLRAKLIEDVQRYLLINEVDGFDIDWEFPVWSWNAQPTDRKGLSDLVRELRQSFDEAKSDLLLTAAVGAQYAIVDKAYDVEVLNKYLDYVQIMNYDYHMYSKVQPVTGFNAPLFPKLFEFGILGKMNSDYSTRYWLKKGLWTNKTVFGMPTYGRGYTLLSKYLHFLYAPAVGDATIGATYSYVCNLTKTKEYNYVFDTNTRSAYIYGGDRQWLGLEDPITMFSKAKYIRMLNLAGMMIYDLSSDDYKGDCKRGSYPLIKAAKIALIEKKVKTKSKKRN
ncbi:unnamed protein product [Thelazia callipaeda]|uniref:Glyco_18 domain-containing protein n=1 Tax=Thelazia callipaeda TaxID=103827 RepID=A0A0N5D3X8_THECL|nr:unnamed protein product [Thelazia callipaeda]